MMTLPVFECYPCGLNNAATSQILVDPAVIPILYTTANLYFYLSIILNSFYNTTLSDKQLSLYVSHVGLNNAAISRILVNTDIIPIL